VLAIIRRDVAEDRVRIDTPTQNLESYFLEVVRRAKQQAPDTAGAVAGGPVAAYLREAAPEGAAPDKVLERLTLPSAPGPEPTPAAKPAEAIPAADEQKLAALTQAAPAPDAPASAPAPDAAKPADLSQANEKLSSLLGDQ
jgi:ABC-2 type transport system ATP-binding protein